ncbi:MAG: ornithine carbamoyltransferase [Methanomicrobiales archaeon]|nr:ornithine carbamoyltransferase [Methanomicrobiales archaeon]
MKRDILSILDLTAQELAAIIGDAEDLKKMRKQGDAHPFLEHKTLGMIFEKASTRTRISFEVGMFELGGHALFLNPSDLQLGRGEEMRDTARVLSRYLSGIMIRAYRHQTIEELARHATVPVINGLSDIEHPCQILADILTMQEYFGDVSDLTVAWVGDGNNVCNSLILSSARTGFSVRVATPDNYAPPGSVLSRAKAAGSRVAICPTPEGAAADADVIYTDTWVSMGNEQEHDERIRAFAGYTVDEALLDEASPDAIVMHCLPAHRGNEISDGVIEGRKSVVWDQAENRLHAQKALLVRLLKK